jgi:Mn2+/Fe2+ NRAMP family transporter
MAAVQMMCVRIGKVTGQGLAGNVQQRFPGWQLRVFIVALLVANPINMRRACAAWRMLLKCCPESISAGLWWVLHS